MSQVMVGCYKTTARFWAVCVGPMAGTWRPPHRDRLTGSHVHVNNVLKYAEYASCETVTDVCNGL